MSLGLLTLFLEIPGCASLKEKRSRIKPLLARLHREFNVSVAEVDRQDAWGQAVLACALVSSDPTITRRALQAIPTWLEKNWPDLPLIDEQLEFR
jgi:uncharacterized protein YlxP (DUF503 family)